MKINKILKTFFILFLSLSFLKFGLNVSNAADETGYGPLNPYSNPFHKEIYVSIKKQELRYYQNGIEIDDFLVSTGVYGKDTPPGDYHVLHKYPLVDYIGTNYAYLKTKWNLLFIRGTEPNSDYFIHGAFWHHNWGHRMSHGCVNVSYANMEGLYNWAEVGTPITIYAGDFPNPGVSPWQNVSQGTTK